jgi:hypothetical protein
VDAVTDTLPVAITLGEIITTGPGGGAGAGLGGGKGGCPILEDGR